MGKSKTRRRRPAKRGGVMLSMRSGFRGMSDAVTGAETSGGKARWVGVVVVLLLLAAAVGLLLSNR